MLATARRAGADPVVDAVERDWGGYTGYFADPDGYRWEIAFNPGPIGQLVLPDRPYETRVLAFGTRGRVDPRHRVRRRTLLACARTSSSYAPDAPAEHSPARPPLVASQPRGFLLSTTDQPGSVRDAP